MASPIMSQKRTHADSAPRISPLRRFFFWILPPSRSRWRSASRLGLSAARPTFSLRLPFALWDLAFDLSLVLCLMDFLLSHKFDLRVRATSQIPWSRFQFDASEVNAAR